VNFFKTEFQHKGREYRVGVELGDLKQDGNAPFEVVGAIRYQGEDTWQEVHLTGRFDVEHGTIFLSWDGVDVVQISAADLVQNHLDDALDWVETVIGSIPAVDPLLGCLIKGAAATLIVQVARCWFPIRDTRPLRTLFNKLLDCLRENGFGMAVAFAGRFTRCLIFG
jgi:hypothetical protein